MNIPGKLGVMLGGSAVDVVERIRVHQGELSPAERRVAGFVLSDPHEVAFGTVASVAAGAGAGAGTVMRFGARLGFDGFAALQAEVREDLRRGGERAAARIRQASPDDVLQEAVGLATAAVHDSLGRLDRPRFDRAVRLLATTAVPVVVLASDASRGIGQQFATELAMVRPDVSVLDGNPVAVARSLALVEDRAVVVVLDLPRYDGWLLEAAETARRRGMSVLALTGSELSPLAEGAAVAIAVDSGGAGPFDSHVAALAVFEALVAGVARRLRTSAAKRLERIEAAWRDSSALQDG